MAGSKGRIGIKRLLLGLLIVVLFAAFMAFGFELSLRNASRQLALARAAVIVNNAINASAYREDFALWYERMVRMERDEFGEIQSVVIDGFALNQLAGQMARSIESYIEEDADGELSVSLSSVLGTASIGVGGPRFVVECRALPTVDVDVESRFDHAGINQTKHSLSATIQTQVRFFVAGRVVTYQNQNPIMLCEIIIVGRVPQTYLEGGGDAVLPVLPLSPER